LLQLTKKVEEKYGALSFIDIVLNHCSYDAEWILKEDHCYYNLENTPQLRSAFVFD
jgi:Glycogen debranching enzyme, glucanotransferase domain